MSIFFFIMEQQTISLHYQRMEEWLIDRRAVLGKKYKKEYARLLELAPALVQLVKYDIPAQQRRQQKISSAVDDTHRAIEEATKSALKFEEKRTRMIEEYDLHRGGDVNVETNLEGAVDARIASSITALSGVLRELGSSHYLAMFRGVYDDFLSKYSSGMYGGGAFSQHFPWLERVFEERFHAIDEGTNRSQEGVAAATEQQSNGVGCVIDWGDVGTSEPIDVGAVVEINWENDVVANCTNDDEECLPPAVAEGVATVSVANAVHRKNILAELQAMRCFASERANAGDNSLDVCHEPVLAVEKQLTTSTEAFFVRMHTSQTARVAFIDEIQRFRRAATAAVTRKASSEARLQQVLEELQEMEPQLEVLLQSARACRDECLVELSKMFPGQRVVMVGDINKFL